jgi:hypothetical protein
VRYTQSLWERLNGAEPSYRPTFEDILSSLLDAQSLEDLVAVYLQREHGYLALPAARRRTRQATSTCCATPIPAARPSSR